MSNIVDRTYLEIDGEVVVCSSITEDIDPTSTIVEGMSRDNRALGRATGNPKFKLSAETSMKKESDIDFERLALDQTEFSAFIEHEGGRSKTYTDCVIDKVTVKSQTAKDVTYSLEISALNLVLN